MTDITANLGQQRLAGQRARHRHRWATTVHWNEELRANIPTGTVHCLTCKALQDPAKSRAGTSARRLGHDQERRIERVYGPRKVGEFGDAIDLLGRDWKWQSKATRGALPRAWESWGPPAPVANWSYIDVPMAALTRLRLDLRPLVIFSWVSRGVSVRDFIVVRFDDWDALHRLDFAPTRYVAMTGQHFLDVHGRDEP